VMAIRILLLICAVLSFESLADADHAPPLVIEGLATVVDGDGLKVEGTAKSIRMADIDAPELDQPYGPEASLALQQMLGDGYVQCEVDLIGDRGRLIATCYPRTSAGWSSVSLNNRMVRGGHAARYIEYSDNDGIRETEDVARKNCRGMWDDISPWCHRKK